MPLSRSHYEEAKVPMMGAKDVDAISQDSQREMSLSPSVKIRSWFEKATLRDAVWIIFAIVCLLAFTHKIWFVFFGVDDFLGLRAAQNGMPRTPDLLHFYAGRFLSERMLFFWHYHLFGLLAPFYKVFGFILHGLTSIVIFRILSTYGDVKRSTAYLTAFIFLLHPSSFLVLTWCCLGFNEATTLFITTIAIMAFMEWLIKGHFAPLIMLWILFLLAPAFKNQAIFMPFYLVVVAAGCTLKQGSPPWDKKRCWRVGIACLPLAIFNLWYVKNVLPASPSYNHPAYALIWHGEVLFKGYLTSLYHGLQILPWMRFPLGYRQALPAALSSWNDAYVMTWQSAYLGFLAVWAMFQIRKQRKNVLFLGLALGLTLFLTSYLAAMPGHRYEYYLYYASPVFAWLLAMALAPLAERLSRQGKAVVAVLAVIVSARAGSLYYHHDDFVETTRDVKTMIDAFRSENVRSRAIMITNPGIEAYNDSVSGVAFHVCLADLDNRYYFASVGQRMPAEDVSRGYIAATLEGNPGYGSFHLRQVAGTAASAPIH